jgi:hypothetical protein
LFASLVDLSSAPELAISTLVMAPLRGAKRRKRQPEKALPAGVTAPMPPPDAADWWDSFSRRLAAGTHVLSLSFLALFRPTVAPRPSLTVPVPHLAVASTVPGNARQPLGAQDCSWPDSAGARWIRETQTPPLNLHCPCPHAVDALLNLLPRRSLIRAITVNESASLRCAFRRWLRRAGA